MPPTNKDNDNDKIKYDIVERKVRENHEVDYSNWPARRVAEHLIAAGRRRVHNEPPYEFPGYCRFPYNNYAAK